MNIESLPNELLLYMMGFLRRQDLEVVRALNTRFMLLADDTIAFKTKTDPHELRRLTQEIFTLSKALNDYDLLQQERHLKSKKLEKLTEPQYKNSISNFFNSSFIPKILNFIPNKQAAIEMRSELQKEIADIEAKLEQLNPEAIQKELATTKEKKIAKKEEMRDKVINDCKNELESFAAKTIAEFETQMEESIHNMFEKIRESMLHESDRIVKDTISRIKMEQPLDVVEWKTDAGKTEYVFRHQKQE